MNDMTGFDYTPFMVSLKLSVITVSILFVICFPLALLLVYREFPLKVLVESIFTLPMVLPPTVLGFYLLVILSPGHFPGRLLHEVFGVKLAFSFPGIVFAACIFSFPYMLLPLKNGLLNIGQSLIESSYTLGKTRIQTFLQVMVPNMKASIVSALITVFAHTMGAFGVILMIGGNIPGETRVASIVIYEGVDEMNFMKAGVYSAVLVFISLSVMILVNLMNKHRMEDRT